MASTDNVFRLRGRVGNVVFCERYGKTYARSVPMEVRNPQTNQQLTWRSKFRVAVRFYQHVRKTAIREILNVSAKGITSNGYALCMKLNLKAFREDGKIGDFSQIHFSAGRRSCVYHLTGEVDEENRVVLRWMNDRNTELVEMNDRLMVVVIYGNREFVPFLLDGLDVKRKDCFAVFRVARSAGVKVHLYCFFASVGEPGYSNSQYLCL